MSNFTAEQQAERRKGVGASEVPAIVGVDPYRSAMDVYLEKAGLAEPFEGNVATRLGSAMEEAIAAEYEYQMREQGVPVYFDPLFDGTRSIHKAGTPYFCSPDKLVRVEDSEVEGVDWGLEVKRRSFRTRKDFGEEGTDEVPENVMVQCQWSMFVTGLPRWDVATMLDNEFKMYTLTADREIHAYLEAIVAEFWRNCEAGVPPAFDHSEGTKRYLAAVYGTQADHVVLDEPEQSEARSWAVEFDAARAREKEALAIKEIFGARLKDRIGLHSGLRGRDWKATWNQTKPSLVTDWRAVAEALAERCQASDALDDCVAQFTREVPGHRRFLLTFAKEK